MDNEVNPRWAHERLQLMLESALEGQEAALASQAVLCSYLELLGRKDVARRHRDVIVQVRKSIRATRAAALALRR